MIRPATGDDLNVIADTWKKSNWTTGIIHCLAHRSEVPGAADVMKPVGLLRGDYKSGIQIVIERLLTMNGVQVMCSDDDATVVLGWICATPPDTLHYVYVKASCRRLGMCTELMKAAKVYDADPLYVTHMTQKIRRWKSRRFIRYDPYRVGA